MKDARRRERFDSRQGDKSQCRAREADSRRAKEKQRGSREEGENIWRVWKSRTAEDGCGHRDGL